MHTFSRSGGWWENVNIPAVMMISLDRTSVWAATYSFISRLGICKFKTSHSDERFPPCWARLYLHNLPAANTEMHIRRRKTLDHGWPGSVQTGPKTIKLFVTPFFLFFLFYSSRSIKYFLVSSNVTRVEMLPLLKAKIQGRMTPHSTMKREEENKKGQHFILQFL